MSKFDEEAYWTQAGEVEACVYVDIVRSGIDLENDDLDAQFKKAITDAVNDAWTPGIDHKAWVLKATELLASSERNVWRG